MKSAAIHCRVKSRYDTLWRRFTEPPPFGWVAHFIHLKVSRQSSLHCSCLYVLAMPRGDGNRVADCHHCTSKQRHAIVSRLVFGRCLSSKLYMWTHDIPYNGPISDSWPCGSIDDSNHSNCSCIVLVWRLGSPAPTMIPWWTEPTRRILVATRLTFVPD